jgi:small subunit ribosomal protein S2
LAQAVIRELIEAGVHFGHRASRWNPKMAPYILTKRNSIHIIDPKETLKGLMAARKFFSQVVADGKDVLLVGTKRQARHAIEENARRVEMHFVNDRWLGGTLTNFRTIRSRLGRLEKLEQLDADGLLAQRSKKEDARLRREMRKIKRNLDGIRHMDRLPGVVFVVDAHREVNALREAHKLGIPTAGMVDTDSDPDLVDIPIPANDDAMRAIELIVTELCDSVATAKAQRTDKSEEAGQEPRRRSSRPVMGRAESDQERHEPSTRPEEPPPTPAAPTPLPPAQPPAAGQQ